MTYLRQLRIDNRLFLTKLICKLALVQLLQYLISNLRTDSVSSGILPLQTTRTRTRLTWFCRFNIWTGRYAVQHVTEVPIRSSTHFNRCVHPKPPWSTFSLPSSSSNCGECKLTLSRGRSHWLQLLAHFLHIQRLLALLWPWNSRASGCSQWVKR